jgi:hypothetical protein
MEPIVVASWHQGTDIAHLVPSVFRPDLALSYCGIDNRESWNVWPEWPNGSVLCRGCSTMYTMEQLRKDGLA